MLNCNNTTIYVGTIPNSETTQIPADVVNLTGLLDGFGTTQISGLTRPKAEINRSALAGANASRISGVKITERNIVMDIVPQGDGEEMRQALYYILPFDTILRFYVATKQRCVYIDGYVEELEGDEPNGDEFSVQVSILCPFPWFQSVELHTMKLVVGENAIRYSGDAPAGWELDVPAQASPPLIGSVGDLSVEIGGETFAYEGNVSIPYICTIPKKRAFNGYRTASSGSTTGTFAPAFGSMVKDSAWPLITRDATTVTVSCSSSTQEFFEQQNTFSYRDTFSGV